MTRAHAFQSPWNGGDGGSVGASLRVVKGRSGSNVIISRQIADDSCHRLLMAFIIKIPYGGSLKNKRKKITQMINGPFICRAYMIPTRLSSVNITLLKSERGTETQISLSVKQQGYFLL